MIVGNYDTRKVLDVQGAQVEQAIYNGDNEVWEVLVYDAVEVIPTLANIYDGDTEWHTKLVGIEPKSLDDHWYKCIYTEY